MCTRVWTRTNLCGRERWAGVIFIPSGETHSGPAICSLGKRELLLGVRLEIYWKSPPHGWFLHFCCRELISCEIKAGFLSTEGSFKQMALNFQSSPSSKNSAVMAFQWRRTTENCWIWRGAFLFNRTILKSELWDIAHNRNTSWNLCSGNNLLGFSFYWVRAEILLFQTSFEIFFFFISVCIDLVWKHPKYSQNLCRIYSTFVGCMSKCASCGHRISGRGAWMHCTMSAGKAKTEIIIINLKEILCLPSTVCFFFNSTVSKHERWRTVWRSNHRIRFSSWFTGFKATMYKH